MLFLSGASEPSGASHAPFERLYLKPFHPLIAGHHHLGYPVATVDREWLASVIDHDDLNLPTVILIHRSRRVDHGDAMAERKPASGAHLALIAGGERDGDPCRNPPPLSRRKGHRLLHRSAKIRPRRSIGTIRRKGEIIESAADAGDSDAERIQNSKGKIQKGEGERVDSSS